MHRVKNCVAGLGIALAMQGCVSHPKMSADAPLQLQRGYWVDWARFSQRGREVDRGDAKDNLKKVEESAGLTKTAEVLDVCAVLTAVGSGVLLGTGVAQASNHQQSWPLFLGGAAALGGSITFALSADGKYAGAVNAYNRSLGPHDSPLADP